jgi:hypothetical protein
MLCEILQSKKLSSALILAAILTSTAGCRGFGRQDFSVVRPREPHQFETSSRVVLDVVCSKVVRKADYFRREGLQMLAPIRKAWRYDMTLQVENVVKGRVESDELNVRGLRELTKTEKATMHLPDGFTNGTRMRIAFDNGSNGEYRRLRVLPWTVDMYALFSRRPPIARANPSLRHPVTVRVPMGLRAVRTGDTLTIGWKSLQETNLNVGTNMVLGVEIEKRLYRDGVLCNTVSPDWEFNEVIGGHRLGGAVDFGSADTVLHRRSRRILMPADAYSVEYRCVVFETDIPPQHMWSPGSGKYQVLWERNFKETAKDE